MKKFFAIFLSAMMVLSCLAVMTFTASAEETAASEEEYVVTDATKFTSFPKDVFEGYFTNANQTDLIFNDDGSITFQGTWTTDMTNPMDPFVYFNYGNFLRKFVDKKLQNVPTKDGEYGALVLKVKMDESIAGNFLMHYAVGRGATVDGSMLAYPDIDAEGTGDYEYIIFDLEFSDFTTDIVTLMRFDWVDNNPSATEENVGASMTLYEIALYKDYDEAMVACGLQEPADPNETEAPKDDAPEDTEADGTVAAEGTAAEGDAEGTNAANDEGNATEEKKGCGAVVASASALMLMVAASAAVVLKKKED